MRVIPTAVGLFPLKPVDHVVPEFCVVGVAKDQLIVIPGPRSLALRVKGKIPPAGPKHQVPIPIRIVSDCEIASAKAALNRLFYFILRHKPNPPAEYP